MTLSLRALSDEELLSRLEMLVSQERESLADIVEHLGELARRGTVIDRSYTSLFEYCVKKLKYSEGAAFLRIRAARAAAQFPDILDRLRSGGLHLDAIARLYPHLTQENSNSLLDQVQGATQREVKEFVATLQTEPPPERDVIVPVAAPEAPAEVLPQPHHRFHFTADGDLMSMVSKLRGLLRHKYPDGRLEGIFKEAAASLLQKLEKDKMPLPRPKKAKPARVGSRCVPRTIRRKVWARDGGQCRYTGPDGRRCDSRDALEYDHIIPWAQGGRSDTAENIRLLCRVHNQRLGRKKFGPRRSVG